MYCFANIGVPKNPGNPYYEMTDPISNPTGYNPLGSLLVEVFEVDWRKSR
jgi:hypothetical protein